MITQVESGLTPLEHSRIQSDDYEGNYRVVAERYNPLWQNVTIDGPSTGIFSACVHNNTVFRLTSSGLQTMTPSAVASVGAFTFRAGVPTDACLVSGNGALHVLIVDSVGVWWTYSTTGTSAFAAWQSVTLPHAHLQDLYYTVENMTLSFVSSTSAFAGGTTGAMAFDDNPATYYRATTIAHTLAFQNPLRPTFFISGFTVTAQSWDANNQAAFKHTPKKFKIDMNLPGGWTEVLSVKNQTDWKSGEKRTFMLPSPISTALADFRIRFEKNNGGTELRVAEVDVLERLTDAAFGYTKIDADVWNIVRVLYKNHTNGCHLVGQFSRASNAGAWTYVGQSYVTDQQTVDIACTGGGAAPIVLKRAPGTHTKRTVNKILKTYVFNAMEIGAGNQTLFGLNQVDGTEDWSLRYWTEINTSLVGGRYYLTAHEFIKSEQSKSPLISTQMYSSFDSLNWTRGERIQPPSNTAGKFTGACKILELVHSGQLYIAFVWRDGIGYTKPVAMFPFAVDSTLQSDITSIIKDYKFERGQFTSASGTLDDSSATLGSSTVIGQTIRTVLKHYFGYWDGTTRKETLVGTTDLDTFDRVESSTSPISWSWNSRDISFRLVDRNQALSFSETPSFQPFIDDFNIEVGTEYAGLGHVYTDGSWEATKDPLGGYALVANGGSATAAPATALFTFGDSDIADGTIYVRPSDFTTTPWNRFEIVFRAIDKDNFWSFRFNKTGGSQLAVTRNGVLIPMAALGGDPAYGGLGSSIEANGIWFRFYGCYITIFLFTGTWAAGGWSPDFASPVSSYRVPSRIHQVVGAESYTLIDNDYPSRGAVGVRFS